MKINLEVCFKYYSVHRYLTKEVKCYLILPFIAYKSRKTQMEAKWQYSFNYLASREVIGLHFNAFFRIDSEI